MSRSLNFIKADRSLLGLMYNMRLLNKKINQVSYVFYQQENTVINQAHLYTYFLTNYYGHDWYPIMRTTKFNEETKLQLAKTQFHTLLDWVDMGGYPNNDKYDFDTIYDCFNQLSIGLSFSTKDQCYNHVQLDNTEHYNLSLIHIPLNQETSLHNYSGLTFYRPLIPSQLQDYNGKLREIKYLNYGTRGNDITTRIVGNGLSTVYSNEFHQLLAIDDDCYLIQILFHNTTLNR